MANRCYTPLKVLRVRIAILSSTGAPDDGSTNGYVSDAITEIGYDPEIEAGDEGTQKNGSGDVCASFKDPDTIKRWNLTATFCKLDPELQAKMTQSTLLASGSISAGLITPGASTSLTIPVSFEAWSYAWNVDQQATDATLGASGVYVHHVWPKVKWRFGSQSLSNALGTIPLAGIGEANSNITANGPFNDWPTFVANAGGVTSGYGWFYDDDVPTAACGAIAVPTGS